MMVNQNMTRTPEIIVLFISHQIWFFHLKKYLFSSIVDNVFWGYHLTYVPWPPTNSTIHRSIYSRGTGLGVLTAGVLSLRRLPPWTGWRSSPPPHLRTVFLSLLLTLERNEWLPLSIGYSVLKDSLMGLAWFMGSILSIKCFTFIVSVRRRKRKIGLSVLNSLKYIFRYLKLGLKN